MPDLKPAPVFLWTQEYAVGVEQIDREHQKLFALVEGMHQAMLAGKGKEALESLLAELVNYTCHHFAHEEGLMQRFGYPGFAEHRRQHEDLRVKVLALQARSASGEITISIEVTLFLIEWLKQHTTTSDRRIGEHLRTKQAGSVTAPPFRA